MVTDRFPTLTGTAATPGRRGRRDSSHLQGRCRRRRAGAQLTAPRRGASWSVGRPRRSRRAVHGAGLAARRRRQHRRERRPSPSTRSCRAGEPARPATGPRRRRDPGQLERRLAAAGARQVGAGARRLGRGLHQAPERERPRGRSAQGVRAAEGRREHPVGSQLDTENGRVALTSAADTGATKTQNADFYQGIFQVKQAVPKKKPKKPQALVTDLVMKGQLPRSQCAPLKGARAAGANKKKGPKCGPGLAVGQRQGQVPHRAASTARRPSAAPSGSPRTAATAP